MQINTKKRLYEAIIARMNKTQAPNISVREFNYELNDVILDVVRDYAMLMESGQIPLDYLRNLKDVIEEITTAPSDKGTILTVSSLIPGADNFKTPVPTDYRHVTGIIVCYTVTGAVVDECYQPTDTLYFGAKRMDSDMNAAIVSDVFQQPRYHDPKYSVIGNNIHIFTGTHTNIDVTAIQLHYIKQPQEVIINLNDSFDTQDTTELEFDLQLNYEIASRLAQRLMERDGNPRMGSHTQVNQVQPSQDAVASTQRPQ